MDERNDAVSEIEIRIINLLAEGFQSKEIARQIKRSPGTVEFYVRGLYLKLHARSRAQLVSQAFERGILQRADSRLQLLEDTVEASHSTWPMSNQVGSTARDVAS